LEHYMPRGNTVTSAMYADLLKNHLHPAIKSKECGRLSAGVLLQHDSARPHSARSTVPTIQDLSFECLPYPLYSAPVTFMSLDRSKRRWEASLSDLTKKCSRQCMSGCDLSHKNFFLEVSILTDLTSARTWTPLWEYCVWWSQETLMSTDWIIWGWLVLVF
jgi:hypothetical protein